jgi:hypothetical protein
MLEQVLEMTSFNCQTCLSLIEQFIKHSLKFLFGNYQLCVPDDFFKFVLCVYVCVCVLAYVRGMLSYALSFGLPTDNSH